MENQDLILTEVHFESKMLKFASLLPYKLPTGQKYTMKFSIKPTVRGYHIIRALFIFNNDLAILSLINVAIFDNNCNLRPVVEQSILPDYPIRRNIMITNNDKLPLIIKSASITGVGITLTRQEKRFSQVQIDPAEEPQYLASLDFTLLPNSSIKNYLYLQLDEPERAISIPLIFISKPHVESLAITPSFIDFGVISTRGVPHRIPIYLIMQNKTQAYVSRYITSDPNLIGHNMTTSNSVMPVDGNWIKKEVLYLVYYNTKPVIYIYIYIGEI